jgi:release factor glutamine methyltransferase
MGIGGHAGRVARGSRRDSQAELRFIGQKRTLHVMDTGTVKRALDVAAQQLAQAGISNAVCEARWLLEHVLRVPTGTLTPMDNTPLDAAQQTAFAALVARRAQRYPLQYLLETVEFVGVTLRVTPDALIPRPETEELVAHAAAAMAGRTAPLHCADLGTGSGCIAIALATRLPQSYWWACDISAAALQLAEENAQRNQCAARITFCCGDFWEALPPAQTFDLACANPPYVAQNYPLPPELQHEPAAALFSGADGLEAYRAIVAQLARRLKPNGVFVGEMGFDQADALRALCRAQGLPAPHILADAQGQPRFVLIRG